MKFNNKLLINFISLIIGLTFIFSAYSKLIDTKLFAETIYNYGFENLGFLAPIIIIFELVIGLQLLFFVNVKQSLLISIFTFIIFTAIFSYGYFVNNIESCGCFGNFYSKILDTPLVLYLKNTILTILSFIAYKYYKQPPENKNKELIQFVITVIIVFASFFTGFTYKSSPINQSSNSNSFINKSTKEVGLQRFYNFNKDSTYIAYIFSYTCPHCLNTVSNVNLFKEYGYVDNVIYLPVGGGKAKIDFDNNFKIIGPRINGASAGISRISGTYPTILFIKNNSITFVNEGFISPPLLFYRYNNVFEN